PGRLLLWIAGFAVLTTMTALLTLGGDAAEISATMRRGMLGTFKAGGVETSADMNRVIDLFVAAVPAFIAIGIVKMLTVNFRLAGAGHGRARPCRRPVRTARALHAYAAAAAARGIGFHHPKLPIIQKENENGSHSAGTRGQAWPDGRSRQSARRLCPQFPPQ